MEQIDVIFNIIDSLGTVGLLVWLVVSFRADLRMERQSHEETRRAYRDDLRDFVKVD